MVAALFEISGWAGLQKYLFTGRDADAILTKLNQVQDLECLIQMGAMYADPLAVAATPKLEEILEKGETGDVTLQDFDGLSIILSVGGLRCVATADGQEAVDALKAAYPDAYVR